MLPAPYAPCSQVSEGWRGLLWLCTCPGQDLILLLEHMTCLTRNLQSRNVDNVMLRHDCEGVVTLIHRLQDGNIEAAKVRHGVHSPH
jgi:hypothetical protein